MCTGSENVRSILLDMGGALRYYILCGGWSSSGYMEKISAKIYINKCDTYLNKFRPEPVVVRQGYTLSSSLRFNLYAVNA